MISEPPQGQFWKSVQEPFPEEEEQCISDAHIAHVIEETKMLLHCHLSPVRNIK